MSVYAMDISGSMWNSVDEILDDMRQRVAMDDTIILFTDILHIHRNPAVFLQDPQMPNMGSAEMKIVYDWIAANAAGETLFVYSDGGMMERHRRQDEGRTIVLVTSTPVAERVEEVFPGARVVYRGDW